MSSITGKSTEFDPFAGFVLGMAVGDALGLPREGLSRQRAARMYGGAPLEHRLVFGRGMVSDDTEHMRMTALALLAEPTNTARFAKCLAWKLRWWMLALPAGTGMATAKSIARLWVGWSPDRSGVRSAGNGPAMRAGVLGLCLHRDGDPLREFVRVTTRMTHVDPRAETGALLIALGAREAGRSNGSPIDSTKFLQLCREQPLDDEWVQTLAAVEQSLAGDESAAEFAARLGLDRGISGYIVSTVAAVLFCWLRWPGEFRRPMEEIIQLGGDTDTTAAILGGLAGATCGPESIPQEWLERLIEWPYSVTWMRSVLATELGQRFGVTGLSTAGRQPVVPLSPTPRGINWLAVLGRNLVFLAIVLTHGFRRLLPPYSTSTQSDR